MEMQLQIAVDCADPHALVRFWAAALDYEVEDHHDFVQQMLEEGHADPDDVVEIDGRKAWRSAAACRSDEPNRPRLLFQVVPEEKTTKNRVHLDLQVGPERVDAEVNRLIGLGATRLWEGQQGPHAWVTLADPEGNELCVG